MHHNSMITANRPAFRGLLGIVVAGVLAVTACSANTRASVNADVKSATENAAETVARNIATQQGEEQFTHAQHELAGPLSCKAVVKSGVKKIDIACTGTTKAGQAAALTGTTNELPGTSVVSLSGQFMGTVDGNAVFTTQRLGG